MKPTIPPDAAVLFRVALSVQIIVATWFIFTPDLIPTSFREVEMQNDRPLYETLDNIMVPLVHIKTLLCIALWWPTRTASWAYFLVTTTVVVLGLFAGPSVLSAIDSTLDYVQVIATGATLSVLYLGKFFSRS